jgi:hypothetical protein
VLGGGRIIHCTCCIGFAFYPVLAGHPRSFAWETVVVADRCLVPPSVRAGTPGWGSPPGADLTC